MMMMLLRELISIHILPTGMMMMLLRELISIHILPTGYETLFTLAVSATRQLRSTLSIMILKPGTLGLGNQGIPERAAGPHLCSSGYRTNDLKKNIQNVYMMYI